MKSRSRRSSVSIALALVLAGVATSAGLSIGASPAYALGYLSVDRISVSNVTVASTSCRDIPVRFSISSDGFTSFSSGNTSVYRKSDYLESFFFSNFSDTWYYCPTVDGLGRFTLGPTALSGIYDNYPDFDFFEGTDYTSTSFYIKAKSLLSFSGSQSSSSRVTWTIRAKRYDSSSYFNDGYYRWNPPKVQLQRWNGSAWVKIKNFYPVGTGTSRGVIKYSMNTGKGLRYRVVSNSNLTTWGRTSDVVRTRR